MNNPDDDMEVSYANTETIAGLRERLRRKGAACEVEEVDAECMSLIAALGGEPKSFKREKKRALRRIVSEIYSPPRVTSMLTTLARHDLMPGMALDITCIDPEDGKPWDFDDPVKRERARRRIREEKPVILIGSPVCTAWCSWQALNAQRRDPEVVREEMVRARVHLDFVVSLYREQIEGGRLFLHEHPAGATSWEEGCVKDLLSIEGVERVNGDQCQFQPSLPSLPSRIFF